MDKTANDLSRKLVTDQLIEASQLVTIAPAKDCVLLRDENTVVVELRRAILPALLQAAALTLNDRKDAPMSQMAVAWSRVAEKTGDSLLEQAVSDVASYLSVLCTLRFCHDETPELYEQAAQDAIKVMGEHDLMVVLERNSIKDVIDAG